MNDVDDIDEQLSAAGNRLRGTAPDAQATRQALLAADHAAERAAERADAARRTWRPLAWAGGLTAAAVIAAIVFVGGDSPDTIRELPADTLAGTSTDTLDTVPPDHSEPSATTTAPADLASPDTAGGTDRSTAGRTVVTEFRDADCFRLSLDAPDRRIGSAAGCIPGENLTPNRLFVAELDQEIYRIDVVPGTESDAVPELTIASFPDWGTASCGIIDTLLSFSSSDVVVEIVGCDRSDPAAPVALTARIPQTVGEQPAYFSTPGRNTSSGVALTAPIPLDGVLGVEVLFSSPFPGFRCALIVPAARTAWSEQCGQDSEALPPALALLDGRLVELDLSDESAPRGQLLDERGLPPVGCGLDELSDLISVDEVATQLVITGAICAEQNATLTFSGQLVSNIGGDGGFIEFERTGRFDRWTSIGRGTAGENVASLAIPAFDVWSAWPGQTRSFPFDPDWAEGAGAPTAAEVADRIVDGLNASASSEFPANARVVEVLGRLVVVEEDVGGDDSVAGAVHYVHLIDDGAGALAIGKWFTGSICARGAGPTELCI
jgi:hypothetical protein